jgi:UDP-N-acetyl-L-fucosamine synthase
VYTEHARRHLLSEGFPHRRIYLTGSPLREVLEHYLPKIRTSDVLKRLDLKPGAFFLVSLHREENVDNPEKLTGLVGTLGRLAAAFGVPVVVSTHPRTRKRLEALGISTSATLRFMPPFGFLDYNQLQMHAKCVLSDSGSITEEASILDFPAVTLRTAMERPEGLDTGAIVLTGLDPDVIEAAVRLVVADHDAGRHPPVPADYQITNCAQRVVRLILGTSRLSNAWDGIIPRG